MAGPLAGIRIVEIAGLAAAPFCGMMLADQGAEVILVDRPGGTTGAVGDPARDPLRRSRRSIALDLKSPAAVQVVRDLCRTADGLIEGFRPGVMERLGLGPDALLADNPRLVYGRLTGWGQDGPNASAAGHDIDYIALSGALHASGRGGGKPTPPLNLLGDFGGGGMLLAFGMVAAMLSAARTGRGQLVDAAMVDGAALLMTMVYGFHASGLWQDARGANLIDTGAPFYDTYECADGRFVAVGALEPPFYAALLRLTGLDGEEALRRQHDQAMWPQLAERLAAAFRTRARDEWCTLAAGTDACVAPVLALGEAPGHPHNRARGTFTAIDGLTQPAPAPRFRDTPAAQPQASPVPGADTERILGELGYTPAQIADLRAAGVFGLPEAPR